MERSVCGVLSLPDMRLGMRRFSKTRPLLSVSEEGEIPGLCANIGIKPLLLISGEGGIP